MHVGQLWHACLGLCASRDMMIALGSSQPVAQARSSCTAGHMQARPPASLQSPASIWVGEGCGRLEGRGCGPAGSWLAEHAAQPQQPLAAFCQHNWACLAAHPAVTAGSRGGPCLLGTAVAAKSCCAFVASSCCIPHTSAPYESNELTMVLNGYSLVRVGSILFQYPPRSTAPAFPLEGSLAKRRGQTQHSTCLGH